MTMMTVPFIAGFSGFVSPLGACGKGEADLLKSVACSGRAAELFESIVTGSLVDFGRLASRR